MTAVEIQENSDVTYRLSDSGRPRELHLDHGFTVADLKPYSVNNATVPIAPGRDRLTTCRYFTIERWRIREALEFTPGTDFYHLIVVLDGDGTLAEQPTRQGHVWFVPAASDAVPLDAPGRHRARGVHELSRHHGLYDDVKRSTPSSHCCR